MKFLLDTSIISETAPGKPFLDPDVMQWLRNLAEREALFLSVLTIEELERGIRKLARSGGQKRAEKLSEWLSAVLDAYGDRVLPVGIDVARTAGRMEDEMTAIGRHPGLADVLIASTAKAHSLSVLTANLKHFEPLGVDCWNPLEGVPQI